MVVPLVVVGLSIVWVRWGDSHPVARGAPVSVPVWSDERPESETAVHSGDVDEIVRIRSLQRSLFAGTIFDPGTPADSEQESSEFRKIVSRIAVESDPTLPALPAGTFGQKCEPEYERWIDHQHEPIDGRLSSSLRLSARLLDEKANDLEVSRAFDEADRLRELARQLRGEARDID